MGVDTIAKHPSSRSKFDLFLYFVNCERLEIYFQPGKRSWIKQPVGMNFDCLHEANASIAIRLAWLKSLLPLPSFGMASTGISSDGLISGLSPD